MITKSNRELDQNQDHLDFDHNIDHQGHDHDDPATADTEKLERSVFS